LARIAFVQNLAFEYLGVMYLSAALKQAGHQVEVFLLKRSESDLAKQVLSFRPTLVAFSVTTGMHHWALNFASRIRGFSNVPTIFGGPHATYFPELIENPSVDMICRGEGEQAIVELADKMETGESVHDIPNLWVKIDGEIVRNNLRPLVDDLDLLQNPDRLIYRSKYSFLNKSSAAFMAGRGCPFKCSFCFNEAARQMYKGLGRYVRLRKPENVIQEIIDARQHFKLRIVYMQDDTLLSNKAWVKEFSQLYHDQIGLPLICLLRADQVDEDSIVALKRAGLKNAFFGIESGDERIRNDVLKKGIKDEHIYAAAALLRKHSIGFRTYNMVGLPGETLDEALETMRMNASIRTDYPWCSLFYPFPGTELGRLACERGLLTEQSNDFESASFFRESMIQSPHARQMANLQKLFWYGVKFPVLTPLLERLIELPPNPLFDLLFLASYGISLYGSENMTLREVVSLGLKNVGRFFYGRPGKSDSQQGSK
jgi:anaerobic magnesium-protoporphyrin IX monomethyl ester cyclase